MSTAPGAQTVRGTPDGGVLVVVDAHRPRRPPRDHAGVDGVLSRLRGALEGPPPPLPATLDRAAEAWARATPRLRAVVISVVVVVLVLTAGHGAVRSPWGPPVEVVVATTDLPVGRVVEPGDITTTRWPEQTVPPGALTEPGSAVGRPVAATAPTGSPLTELHVADDGPAAGLPAGEVAVPLPPPSGVVLRPGQRVDLLAGDGARGGVRLAAGARVLGVDGDTVWVAVRRDESPAIVGAATWGDLSVALLPGPSPSGR